MRVVRVESIPFSSAFFQEAELDELQEEIIKAKAWLEEQKKVKDVR
jgi:hypothetical protein